MGGTTATSGEGCDEGNFIIRSLHLMEKENKQVKHGSNKETDRHSEDPLLQCSQGTLLHVLSWSIKYCNSGRRSSTAE